MNMLTKLPRKKNNKTKESILDFELKIYTNDNAKFMT